MHTFATRLRQNGCSLRYGVMVAQEILALLVRVRVLISQLLKCKILQFYKKALFLRSLLG